MKLSILLALIFYYVSNTLAGSGNILILGGDGMMGSATTKLFLQANLEGSSFELTLVNRGNWYWDTEELIKPFVKHYECTRGDGFRETCTQLNDGITYDVIIDFSCYHPLDMEDILIVFRGRFKKYIFISSDSVYEVCKNKNHQGFSQEADATRPVDSKLEEELNKRDSYGHHKLQGEEVLHKFHKVLKYDYISLRLPDVIGPRDNTNRFWKCFLWAKLNEIVGPVTIPEDIKDLPLSFVYSLDVAQLIFSLVNEEHDANVFNNAYNIAFKEQISLKSLFEGMASYLKTPGINFSNNGTFDIGFPSVTRGPVNISKAESMLKWTPTDLNVALKETMIFYNNAQFNGEYKYILDRVLEFLGIKGDKYRKFVTKHHSEMEVRKKEEL